MTDILDEIMAYLLEEPPMPKTAAERTREWRAQARAEGRPEPKTVDAAITEAMAFMMRQQSVPVMTVDIEKLIRVSRIVLVRQGYARVHSINAVIERLKPRALHSQFEQMPSLCLHAKDRMISPPRGGEWLDEDIQLIREIIGQTPAAPPLPTHNE